MPIAGAWKARRTVSRGHHRPGATLETGNEGSSQTWSHPRSHKTCRCKTRKTFTGSTALAHDANDKIPDRRLPQTPQRRRMWAGGFNGLCRQGSRYRKPPRECESSQPGARHSRRRVCHAPPEWEPAHATSVPNESASHAPLEPGTLVGVRSHTPPEWEPAKGSRRVTRHRSGSQRLAYGSESHATGVGARDPGSRPSQSSHTPPEWEPGKGGPGRVTHHRSGSQGGISPGCARVRVTHHRSGSQALSPGPSHTPPEWEPRTRFRGLRPPRPEHSDRGGGACRSRPDQEPTAAPRGV